MSDWIEYRIRELALDSPNAMATGPFGSSISSKFFEAEGVPVIRGGNLSADVTNRMSDNGLVFVSKSKAEEFKRSIVKEGDLVFTCWGTINQVGIITDDLRYKEYVISNKQMKLTVDQEKADPLFLYYLFSSPIKQAEIISSGIGAAVPGFNLGQLKEHVVTLPGVDEQVKISSVLDAFDTKIRLNLQTNQTLEQIAQAIFKSWFVDFEPTRAKIAARERWLALHEVVETSSPACYSAEFDNANQPTQALEEAMTQAAMAAISGKTPEELEQLSPEQQQNLRKIATLFPDTLVDSELGEIPEGWE
ncbi:MAG: restriction endonuclease subunit S, partial [Pseudomonadota bacterium]